MNTFHGTKNEGIQLVTILHPRRISVNSNIQGYSFENFPTPLEFGDVRMYSNNNLNFFVIWRTLTLEASIKKIVTRSLGGRGGVNRIPPPSTFDTFHRIGLKFGTYIKLHLYFQLSKTTWCLDGFHGNNSQLNDVTDGRHLGFSNFQILYKFSRLNLRFTKKQRLAVEIHEIGGIHWEVVSI